MQPASHELEDCFLTKVLLQGWLLLAREVAQIQKGRLQSDFLASAGERSCEHLGALSYASVCY